VKACAVTIDITPATRVPLGASDREALPWAGAAERLEANLLALWGEQGEPVLLVTLDLLYPGRIVRSAIERAAGLQADRVFVGASHTHGAPMTDDTKPALGRTDAAYLEFLTDALTTAVRALLSGRDAVDVVLEAGHSLASHSINRRLRKRIVLGRHIRLDAVVNAPNPDGVTDETITTFRLLDLSGVPTAAAWNYACHPVAYPRANVVAAHFPHRVREALRSAQEKADLPILYFQGFSGNTRPSASGKIHSFRRRLRRILTGPLFDDMTPEAYSEWSSTLSAAVLQGVTSARRIESNTLSSKRLQLPGDDFAHGLREQVSFQRVSIDEQLVLVGVSAEVVAEYADRVREQSTARYTLCVGCIDHVFGYLPTAKIMCEGGYEGGEYSTAFGLNGPNANAESHFYQALDAVLLKP
jgi:hypothetical protein